MLELLDYDFMRRALLAALLVGLAAPTVGIFLIQRRMSLIGDGLGHVAFAGVAVGVVTQGQPVLVALVFAVIGAVVIELLRHGGRTNSDVALALMFYGGIALGVVVMARGTGGSAAMTSFLFGAITTTTASDVAIFAALALVVLVGTWLLRPRLFAVANDPEYAKAVGLPVLALNITLAVFTAVTVVVSMRVVGLLLISALMIVPNAAGQLVARSFRAVTLVAAVIGVACSVGGVASSFYLDTPSGGTIVLLTIAVHVALALVQALRGALPSRRRRHGPPGREHWEGCSHDAFAPEEPLPARSDAVSTTASTEGGAAR